MDVKTTALRWVVAATLMPAVIAPSANAGAPSWSAFRPADFSDIYITPMLSTNMLSYTLSVGPHPTIAVGGHTYDVNWVQAYFVVSRDSKTSFTATAGTVVTDWDWQTKNNVLVAGWSGEGSNRIHPLESKAFEFGSFNIGQNAVLSGMHVGYQIEDCEDSGWFKGSLEAVPEPSPLICLAVGLTGLASVVGRRGRK